ncbi:MAG: ABC transporter permease [Chitinophagaceae bacterium]
MSQNYNQFSAMLAVTKASLRSIFKSPQSIFFSLFFPIVLIVIFGSLGRGGGGVSVDVAFEQNTDTTSFLYQTLKHVPVLNVADRNKRDVEDDLRKGRLTAIISLNKSHDSLRSQYDIHLRTTSAGQKDILVLQTILRDVIHTLDERMNPNRETVATISQSVQPGRRYKYIDFFLPGMIGFSLIGAAVFGVAFAYYSLRETLVLKRLYSTPIKKTYIVLGESLSRVIFQLATVVILIVFGYFVYNFTLAHGIFTFLDMLFLSFLALLVFMGFGFLISNFAKNQNVIPIYANLFMFPQYFLSGTFFSKSVLPEAMQKIVNFLPLTALNDAMRNVAFEGASLASCWPQILVLVVWGVIVYAITIRVFRWD